MLSYARMGECVRLVADLGRASAKLAEQTGVSSSTLHRLLKGKSVTSGVLDKVECWIAERAQKNGGVA